MADMYNKEYMEWFVAGITWIADIMMLLAIIKEIARQYARKFMFREYRTDSYTNNNRETQKLMPPAATTAIANAANNNNNNNNDIHRMGEMNETELKTLGLFCFV